MVPYSLTRIGPVFIHHIDPFAFGAPTGASILMCETFERKILFKKSPRVSVVASAKGQRWSGTAACYSLEFLPGLLATGAIAGHAAENYPPPSY